MLRTSKLVVLLCALSGLALASPSKSPVAPGVTSKNFRLSGEVRPTRYKFNLKVDSAAGSFSGSGRIFLDLARGASAITLHAADLELGKGFVQSGSRTIPVVSISRNRRSETVTLELAEPIRPGKAVLDLDWKGAINRGLRGLYMAGNVAVTQFEAADARRVFPCFDEPEFKARWSLTLDVPKGQVALANGAPLRTERVGDFERTNFGTTRPISSYLVALASGDLASSRLAHVGKTPVRTWAVSNKVGLTKFGQSAARESLRRLEKYFGRRYPFGKLDLVGIPDFQAGAMENAGLVTYRETALLQDPRTAARASLKRVAEVVAHELSHQWFGNLVTMKWWNDLWLNESFATWMAYKIVDKWKPQWHMWNSFQEGTQSAFALDALESTHPIYAKVKNANAARFDVITYEKGGAVLRMIERYVGERAFQKGIHNYLREHAYNNAEADDLWRAIQHASNQPVMALANRWIRQSGFPLVEVSRDGGKLVLRQSRFFSEPGKQGKGLWPVPLIIRYEDATGVHEKRILFDKAQTRIPLGEGEIKWLTANGEASGFYRVAYDASLTRGLVDNVSKLSPTERIGLLSDTWALMRSGRRGVKDWLDMAVRFANEKDPDVIGEVASGLASLEQYYTAAADRPAFRRKVVELFGSQLDRLGWGSAAGKRQSGEGALRRAELLGLVGDVARDPRWESGARDRLRQVMRGDATALEQNLVPLSIRLAARGGDASLFDEYLRRSKSESDPVLKRAYLNGLAAFESPALAARVQELLFTRKVPQQDMSFFVRSLLANPGARGPFWERLQREWPSLVDHLRDAPSILHGIISSFDQLPDREAIPQVKGMLQQRKPPDSDEIIAQTLERMRLKVELNQRIQPEIGAWLQASAKR